MTSLANIRKQAQRGFTLVELLIVVIILAILAAIVVPQFGSSTDEAKLSALDGNLSALRSAINVYKQQHGDFPGMVVGAPPATACTAAPANQVTSSATAATGGDATLFYQQLTFYTNKTGHTCTKKEGEFAYGPYLKEIPGDPVLGLSAYDDKGAPANFIIATSTENLGSLVLPTIAASDKPKGGWIYDGIVGRVFINNGNTPAGSSAPYYKR